MAGLARKFLARALALAALCLLPLASFAGNDYAYVDVKLAVDEADTVNASFDLTHAFTAAFRRRVAGGLNSRALFEISLLDPGEHVIVTAVRECDMRLDVWDDVYYVRVRDDVLHQRRLRLTTLDDALRSCGRVDRIDLVDRSGLTMPEGYRIEVTVLLNPVSQKLLERTREFLANPRGLRGGGQTFFGAVSRLFSSPESAGGEVFLFRSPSQPRPTRAATAERRGGR